MNRRTLRSTSASCNVPFGGVLHGMVGHFQGRLCRFPLRRRDPALGGWLERQAAEIVARQPKDGDVREEVLGILSTQVTVGDLGLDIVARRLAITPRTLQRRLARAGTSFEALCDQARRAAAETYLTNTTLSISEVTYLLGYSEPTAFHRAWRRWFGGITAQSFRERHSQPNNSRN
jgi:AraC-like DNA-binding protein